MPATLPSEFSPVDSANCRAISSTIVLAASPTERIVKAAGDGEFVHVGELSKALLGLYRADRVLLDKVEDALYKAPPPLSRASPHARGSSWRLYAS